MLNMEISTPKIAVPQLKPLAKLSDENQLQLQKFLELEKIRLIPGVTTLEYQGFKTRKQYVLDASRQWWVREFP